MAILPVEINASFKISHCSSVSSPCWELMPPSSHRIVTVRLSPMAMAPRLVTRPKCQTKSVPAWAARLASSSSEPALVIRPVVLSAVLSSAIISCSHFCAQRCCSYTHREVYHQGPGEGGAARRRPSARAWSLRPHRERGSHSSLLLLSEHRPTVRQASLTGGASAVFTEASFQGCTYLALGGILGRA